MKTIFLIVGDIAVSKEPALLKTVLGSCVAVSLWDQRLCIGGLNHYLLPCETGENKDPIYGSCAIDMLVERMAEMGSNRRDLLARIFGGNFAISELDAFSVGRKNVRLARERLKAHGIAVVDECVGKNGGLSIIFHTQTGEAMVNSVLDLQGDARWEVR